MEAEKTLNSVYRDLDPAYHWNPHGEGWREGKNQTLNGLTPSLMQCTRLCCTSTRQGLQEHEAMIPLWLVLPRSMIDIQYIVTVRYDLSAQAQGQPVGAQGHRAAVGGVAQGVDQSPRPISGAAAAEEGNSGSHAKAFPLGGFTYPAFIVSRKILLCQCEEIDFGLIGFRSDTKEFFADRLRSGKDWI